MAYCKNCGKDSADCNGPYCWNETSDPTRTRHHFILKGISFFDFFKNALLTHEICSRVSNLLENRLL